MSRRPSAERGQITVMVAGLSLVCFALAGLAVDGTRAFLFRRTLQNGADASALAGASELHRAAFRSNRADIFLARDSAREVASAYLRERRLRVDAEVAVDGGHIGVLLRGEIGTTFLALVGIEALPVSARAEARPVEGAP